MPPTKYRDTERAYGKPMAQIITETLEETKTARQAAIKLGIGPTSLFRWAARAGLELDCKPCIIVRTVEIDAPATSPTGREGKAR